MCFFVGMIVFFGLFLFVWDFFVLSLEWFVRVTDFSCPVHVSRLVLLHLCAGSTCLLKMTHSTESFEYDQKY